MKPLKSKVNNKPVVWLLIVIFLCQFTGLSGLVYGQTLPIGPTPLAFDFSMAGDGVGFKPIVLEGLKLYRDDPFRMDFIVNRGDDFISDGTYRRDVHRLIRYFLTALTIPEDDLWVNLSPYESRRIIPQKFGQTEMGRDLLSQDYFLKQISSAILHPDTPIGKNFWDKVYAQMYDQFQSTEVPTNLFNKIWVVPGEARVYQNNDAGLVVDAKLKLLLEDDYLAQYHGQANHKGLDEKQDHMTLDKNLMRQVILPILEKELNEGRHFAKARQIYHSLIIATWFKRVFKESLLGKVFVDQKRMGGLDFVDASMKEEIFQQYVRSFSEGIYDLVQEEYDPLQQEMKTRRYFAGGIFGRLGDNFSITEDSDQAEMTFADGSIRDVFQTVANPIDDQPQADRHHKIESEIQAYIDQQSNQIDQMLLMMARSILIEWSYQEEESSSWNEEDIKLINETISKSFNNWIDSRNEIIDVIGEKFIQKKYSEIIESFKYMIEVLTSETSFGERFDIDRFVIPVIEMFTIKISMHPEIYRQLHLEMLNVLYDEKINEDKKNFIFPVLPELSADGSVAEIVIRDDRDMPHDQREDDLIITLPKRYAGHLMVLKVGEQKEKYRKFSLYSPYANTRLSKYSVHYFRNVNNENRLLVTGPKSFNFDEVYSRYKSEMDKFDNPSKILGVVTLEYVKKDDIFEDRKDLKVYNKEEIVDIRDRIKESIKGDDLLYFYAFGLLYGLLINKKASREKQSSIMGWLDGLSFTVTQDHVRRVMKENTDKRFKVFYNELSNLSDQYPQIKVSFQLANAYLIENQLRDGLFLEIVPQNFNGDDVVDEAFIMFFDPAVQKPLQKLTPGRYVYRPTDMMPEDFPTNAAIVDKEDAIIVDGFNTKGDQDTQYYLHKLVLLQFLRGLKLQKIFDLYQGHFDVISSQLKDDPSKIKEIIRTVIKGLSNYRLAYPNIFQPIILSAIQMKDASHLLHLDGMHFEKQIVQLPNGQFGFDLAEGFDLDHVYLMLPIDQIGLQALDYLNEYVLIRAFKNYGDPEHLYFKLTARNADLNLPELHFKIDHTSNDGQPIKFVNETEINNFQVNPSLQTKLYQSEKNFQPKMSRARLDDAFDLAYMHSFDFQRIRIEVPDDPSAFTNGFYPYKFSEDVPDDFVFPISQAYQGQLVDIVFFVDNNQMFWEIVSVYGMKPIDSLVSFGEKDTIRVRTFEENLVLFTKSHNWSLLSAHVGGPPVKRVVLSNKDDSESGYLYLHYYHQELQSFFLKVPKDFIGDTFKIAAVNYKNKVALKISSEVSNTWFLVTDIPEVNVSNEITENYGEIYSYDDPFWEELEIQQQLATMERRFQLSVLEVSYGDENPYLDFLKRMDAWNNKSVGIEEVLQSPGFVWRADGRAQLHLKPSADDENLNTDLSQNLWPSISIPREYTGYDVHVRPISFDNENVLFELTPLTDLGYRNHSLSRRISGIRYETETDNLFRTKLLDVVDGHISLEDISYSIKIDGRADDKGHLHFGHPDEGYYFDVSSMINDDDQGAVQKNFKYGLLREKDKDDDYQYRFFVHPLNDEKTIRYFQWHKGLMRMLTDEQIDFDPIGSVDVFPLDTGNFTKDKDILAWGEKLRNAITSGWDSFEERMAGETVDFITSSSVFYFQIGSNMDDYDYGFDIPDYLLGRNVRLQVSHVKDKQIFIKWTPLLGNREVDNNVQPFVGMIFHDRKVNGSRGDYRNVIKRLADGGEQSIDPMGFSDSFFAGLYADLQVNGEGEMAIGHPTAKLNVQKYYHQSITGEYFYFKVEEKASRKYFKIWPENELDGPSELYFIIRDGHFIHIPEPFPKDSHFLSQDFSEGWSGPVVDLKAPVDSDEQRKQEEFESSSLYKALKRHYESVSGDNAVKIAQEVLYVLTKFGQNFEEVDVTEVYEEVIANREMNVDYKALLEESPEFDPALQSFMKLSFTQQAEKIGSILEALNFSNSLEDLKDIYPHIIEAAQLRWSVHQAMMVDIIHALQSDEPTNGEGKSVALYTSPVNPQDGMSHLIITDPETDDVLMDLGLPPSYANQLVSLVLYKQAKSYRRFHIEPFGDHKGLKIFNGQYYSASKKFDLILRNTDFGYSQGLASILGNFRSSEDFDHILTWVMMRFIKSEKAKVFDPLLANDKYPSLYLSEFIVSLKEIMTKGENFNKHLLEYLYAVVDLLPNIYNEISEEEGQYLLSFLDGFSIDLSDQNLTDDYLKNIEYVKASRITIKRKHKNLPNLIGKLKKQHGDIRLSFRKIDGFIAGQYVTNQFIMEVTALEKINTKPDQIYLFDLNQANKLVEVDLSQAVYVQRNMAKVLEFPSDAGYHFPQTTLSVKPFVDHTDTPYSFNSSDLLSIFYSGKNLSQEKGVDEIIKDAVNKDPRKAYNIISAAPDLVSVKRKYYAFYQTMILGSIINKSAHLLTTLAKGYFEHQITRLPNGRVGINLSEGSNLDGIYLALPESLGKSIDNWVGQFVMVNLFNYYPDPGHAYIGVFPRDPSLRPKSLTFRINHKAEIGQNFEFIPSELPGFIYQIPDTDLYVSEKRFLEGIQNDEASHQFRQFYQWITVDVPDADDDFEDGYYFYPLTDQTSQSVSIPIHQSYRGQKVSISIVPSVEDSFDPYLIKVVSGQSLTLVDTLRPNFTPDLSLQTFDAALNELRHQKSLDDLSIYANAPPVSRIIQSQNRGSAELKINSHLPPLNLSSNLAGKQANISLIIQNNQSRLFIEVPETGDRILWPESEQDAETLVEEDDDFWTEILSNQKLFSMEVHSDLKRRNIGFERFISAIRQWQEGKVNLDVLIDKKIGFTWKVDNVARIDLGPRNPNNPQDVMRLYLDIPQQFWRQPIGVVIDRFENDELYFKITPLKDNGWINHSKRPITSKLRVGNPSLNLHRTQMLHLVNHQLDIDDIEFEFGIQQAVNQQGVLHFGHSHEGFFFDVTSMLKVDESGTPVQFVYGVTQSPRPLFYAQRADDSSTIRYFQWSNGRMRMLTEEEVSDDQVKAIIPRLESFDDLKAVLMTYWTTQDRSVLESHLDQSVEMKLKGKVYHSNHLNRDVIDVVFGEIDDSVISIQHLGNNKDVPISYGLVEIEGRIRLKVVVHQTDRDFLSFYEVSDTSPYLIDLRTKFYRAIENQDHSDIQLQSEFMHFLPKFSIKSDSQGSYIEIQNDGKALKGFRIEDYKNNELFYQFSMGSIEFTDLESGEDRVKKLFLIYEFSRDLGKIKNLYAYEWDQIISENYFISKIDLSYIDIYERFFWNLEYQELRNKVDFMIFDQVDLQEWGKKLSYFLYEDSSKFYEVINQPIRFNAVDLPFIPLYRLRDKKGILQFGIEISPQFYNSTVQLEVNETDHENVYIKISALLPDGSLNPDIASEIKIVDVANFQKIFAQKILTQIVNDEIDLDQTLFMGVRYNADENGDILIGHPSAKFSMQPHFTQSIANEYFMIRTKLYNEKKYITVKLSSDESSSTESFSVTSNKEVFFIVRDGHFIAIPEAFPEDSNWLTQYFSSEWTGPVENFDMDSIIAPGSQSENVGNVRKPKTSEGGSSRGRKPAVSGSPSSTAKPKREINPNGQLWTDFTIAISSQAGEVDGGQLEVITTPDQNLNKTQWREILKKLQDPKGKKQEILTRPDQVKARMDVRNEGYDFKEAIGNRIYPNGNTQQTNVPNDKDVDWIVSFERLMGGDGFLLDETYMVVWLSPNMRYQYPDLPWYRIYDQNLNEIAQSDLSSYQQEAFATRIQMMKVLDYQAKPSTLIGQSLLISLDFEHEREHLEIGPFFHRDDEQWQINDLNSDKKYPVDYAKLKIKTEGATARVWFIEGVGDRVRMVITSEVEADYDTIVTQIKSAEQEAAKQKLKNSDSKGQESVSVQKTRGPPTNRPQISRRRGRRGVSNLATTPRWRSHQRKQQADELAEEIRLLNIQLNDDPSGVEWSVISWETQRHIVESVLQEMAIEGSRVSAIFHEQFYIQPLPLLNGHYLGRNFIRYWDQQWADSYDYEDESLLDFIIASLSPQFPQESQPYSEYIFERQYDRATLDLMAHRLDLEVHELMDAYWSDDLIKSNVFGDDRYRVQALKEKYKKEAQKLNMEVIDLVRYRLGYFGSLDPESLLDGESGLAFVSESAKVLQPERIFINIETLFQPQGWVGSVDWAQQKYQKSPHNLLQQMHRHNERLSKISQYFRPRINDMVEIIKELSFSNRSELVFYAHEETLPPELLRQWFDTDEVVSFHYDEISRTIRLLIRNEDETDNREYIINTQIQYLDGDRPNAQALMVERYMNQHSDYNFQASEFDSSFDKTKPLLLALGQRPDQFSNLAKALQFINETDIPFFELQRRIIQDPEMDYDQLKKRLPKRFEIFSQQQLGNFASSEKGRMLRRPIFELLYNRETPKNISGRKQSALIVDHNQTTLDRVEQFSKQWIGFLDPVLIADDVFDQYELEIISDNLQQLTDLINDQNYDDAAELVIVIREQLINAVEIVQVEADASSLEQTTLNIYDNLIYFYDQLKDIVFDSLAELKENSKDPFNWSALDEYYQKNMAEYLSMLIKAKTLVDSSNDTLDRVIMWYLRQIHPLDADLIMDYLRSEQFLYRNYKTRQPSATHAVTVNMDNMFSTVAPAVQLIKSILGQESPETFTVLITDPSMAAFGEMLKAYRDFAELEFNIQSLPFDYRKGDTENSLNTWLDRHSSLKDLSGHVLMIDRSLADGQANFVSHVLKSRGVEHLDYFVLQQDQSLIPRDIDRLFSFYQSTKLQNRLPSGALDIKLEKSLLAPNPLSSKINIQHHTQSSLPIDRLGDSSIQEQLESGLVDGMSYISAHDPNWADANIDRDGNALTSESPDINGVSDQDVNDLYNSVAPTYLGVGEFSLSGLNFKPITNVDDLNAYRNRKTLNRSADRYGDQLRHEDVSVIGIYKDDQLVGGLQLLAVSLPEALRDPSLDFTEALLLDYIDLDYEIEMDDFKKFVSSLVAQLQNIAYEQLNIANLIVARRLEPMREGPQVVSDHPQLAIELQNLYQHHPVIQGNLYLREYIERETELTSAQSELYDYYQDSTDLEVREENKNGLRLMINDRFNTLGDFQFRLMARRLPESLQAEISPKLAQLDALRLYAFTPKEKSIWLNLKIAYGLGKTDDGVFNTLITTLSSRRDAILTTDNTKTVALWRQRIVHDYRGVSNWDEGARLAYAILHEYDQTGRLQTGTDDLQSLLFSNDTGRSASARIIRRVLMDQYHHLDPRKWDRALFIQYGLEHIWSGVFRGDIQAVADAIYQPVDGKSQFLVVDEGQLAVFDLDESGLKAYLQGKLIAPGRSYNGKINRSEFLNILRIWDKEGINDINTLIQLVSQERSDFINIMSFSVGRGEILLGLSFNNDESRESIRKQILLDRIVYYDEANRKVMIYDPFDEGLYHIYKYADSIKDDLPIKWAQRKTYPVASVVKWNKPYRLEIPVLSRGQRQNITLTIPTQKGQDVLSTLGTRLIYKDKLEDLIRSKNSSINITEVIESLTGRGWIKDLDNDFYKIIPYELRKKKKTSGIDNPAISNVMNLLSSDLQNKSNFKLDTEIIEELLVEIESEASPDLVLRDLQDHGWITDQGFARSYEKWSRVLTTLSPELTRQLKIEIAKRFITPYVIELNLIHDPNKGNKVKVKQVSPLLGQEDVLWYQGYDAFAEYDQQQWQQVNPPAQEAIYQARTKLNAPMTVKNSATVEVETKNNTIRLPMIGHNAITWTLRKNEQVKIKNGNIVKVGVERHPIYGAYVSISYQEVSPQGQKKRDIHILDEQFFAKSKAGQQEEFKLWRVDFSRMRLIDAARGSSPYGQLVRMDSELYWHPSPITNNDLDGNVFVVKQDGYPDLPIQGLSSYVGIQPVFGEWDRDREIPAFAMYDADEVRDAQENDLPFFAKAVFVPNYKRDTLIRNERLTLQARFQYFVHLIKQDPVILLMLSHTRYRITDDIATFINNKFVRTEHYFSYQEIQKLIAMWNQTDFDDLNLFDDDTVSLEGYDKTDDDIRQVSRVIKKRYYTDFRRNPDDILKEIQSKIGDGQAEDDSLDQAAYREVLRIFQEIIARTTFGVAGKVQIHGKDAALNVGQKGVLHFADHTPNGNAINAGDVGTGKTVTALEFLYQLKYYRINTEQNDLSNIGVAVVPKPVLSNWLSEIRIWTDKNFPVGIFLADQVNGQGLYYKSPDATPVRMHISDFIALHQGSFRLHADEFDNDFNNIKRLLEALGQGKGKIAKFKNRIELALEWLNDSLFQNFDQLTSEDQLQITAGKNRDWVIRNRLKVMYDNLIPDIRHPAGRLRKYDANNNVLTDPMPIILTTKETLSGSMHLFEKYLLSNNDIYEKLFERRNDGESERIIDQLINDSWGKSIDQYLDAIVTAVAKANSYDKKDFPIAEAYRLRNKLKQTMQVRSAILKIDDYVLVGDEVHAFTNIMAQVTKAMMAIAIKAKRLMLMSATPIKGLDTGKAFPLLRMMNPSLYRDLSSIDIDSEDAIGLNGLLDPWMIHTETLMDSYQMYVVEHSFPKAMLSIVQGLDSPEDINDVWTHLTEGEDPLLAPYSGDEEYMLGSILPAFFDLSSPEDLPLPNDEYTPKQRQDIYRLIKVFYYRPTDQELAEYNQMAQRWLDQVSRGDEDIIDDRSASEDEVLLSTETFVHPSKRVLKSYAAGRRFDDSGTAMTFDPNNSRAQHTKQVMDAILSADPQQKMLLFTTHKDITEALAQDVLNEFGTSYIHGDIKDEARDIRHKVFNGEASLSEKYALTKEAFLRTKSRNNDELRRDVTNLYNKLKESGMEEALITGDMVDDWNKDSDNEHKMLRRMQYDPLIMKMIQKSLNDNTLSSHLGDLITEINDALQIDLATMDFNAENRIAMMRWHREYHYQVRTLMEEAGSLVDGNILLATENGIEEIFNQIKVAVDNPDSEISKIYQRLLKLESMRDPFENLDTFKIFRRSYQHADKLIQLQRLFLESDDRFKELTPKSDIRVLVVTKVGGEGISFAGKGGPKYQRRGGAHITLYYEDDYETRRQRMGRVLRPANDLVTVFGLLVHGFPTDRIIAEITRQKELFSDQMMTGQLLDSDRDDQITEELNLLRQTRRQQKDQAKEQTGKEVNIRESKNKGGFDLQTISDDLQVDGILNTDFRYDTQNLQWLNRSIIGIEIQIQGVSPGISQIPMLFGLSGMKKDIQIGMKR